MINLILSQNTLVQVITVAFITGGGYMWVRSSIKSFEERIKKLEEVTIKNKEDTAELRYKTMTKEDSFRAFVSKELLAEKMNNIESKLEQLLQVFNESIKVRHE